MFGDDTLSDLKDISIGVPQGPFFFLIYVNNLLTDISNGSIVSYIDDTAVVINGQTVNVMNVILIEIDKRTEKTIFKRRQDCVHNFWFLFW